jgi:predicted PurR-regulated permease PerM
VDHRVSSSPLVPEPPEGRAQKASARAESRGARITFGILVLVATALFLLVIWPFRAPLFLAVVLAAVFQRPFERTSAWLRGRRKLASALLTLAVFFAIVLPFASIAAFAVRETVVGLDYLHDELGISNVSDLKSGPLPPRAEAAINRTLAAVHLDRRQLQEGIGRVSEEIRAAAPEVLASSGRAAFHTVIMIIALYFLLLEGGRLIEWLGAVSPLQARQTRELLTEFRKVSNASVVGTVASALGQGVLAAIGFAITRVPHALFFGLLTAVASFVPIIGTAIVWVPAVLLLGITGHMTSAVVLGVWCVVFVIGGEHIGKPLLLKGQVEMHTGLVFLSLLGGLEVFGLLGIVIGPLVVSFFLALMRMYQRDFQRIVEVH